MNCLGGVDRMKHKARATMAAKPHSVFSQCRPTRLKHLNLVSTARCGRSPGRLPSERRPDGTLRWI
jgi:hypothetical protein